MTAALTQRRSFTDRLDRVLEGGGDRIIGLLNRGITKILEHSSKQRERELLRA